MSKNNTLANNISKEVRKSQTGLNNNQIKLLNSKNAEKPTLIENIVANVKEKMNNNLKMYIFIMIPVLLFLAFIVYKYSFTSRSADIIAKMDYKTKITIPNIPHCNNIDVTQQYKLCDYYISSSFMTPCVGNHHYDYVSNDMVNEVIQSGARYIQIPICEADVSLQALPVVGTTVYGEKIITSLNTLEITSTLKIIRKVAFNIKGKPVNQPIIVHLILNTNNAYTLNSLSYNISDIFGDVLIDVEKYKTFPIFLEKLCNLHGKIILFATPEYMGTKLAKFIVPTTKLFEIYHFSELGPLNMPNETIYKKEYNNKLSSKQQYKSNKYFKSKYPTIDYIINNANSVGANIINDTNILDNLVCFNKVGMTVVKPQYPEDVISSNYDFSESIYLGCQFTTMNFQVNDVNMQNYLSIFKESSFRLKPDSMRFSEVEEPVPDLLKVYKSILQTDTNLINNFFYEYNNCLVAFESYTLQNTFLTQIENNLRFTIGSNKIKDKYGNSTYKLNINQCFIPRKSTISSSNNISIYLESASLPLNFVTLNNNIFDLESLANSKKLLINQALYIENPKTVDTEKDGKMLSIKNTDNNNPMYLAFENKIVKAYANTTEIEAQNNMTFILHNIPFKYVIKILTIFNGSLKTMGGNIIGVLENNNTDGTSYYVHPMKTSNNNNFNLFKDQFILQNKETKTYVLYDPDTLFLYDKETQPNRNGTFNMESTNGFYKLLNINNDNLALVDTNLIKFVKETDIISNENLFTIDISYELE